MVRLKILYFQCPSELVPLNVSKSSNQEKLAEYADSVIWKGAQPVPQNGDCLCMIETGPPTKGCVCYDHRGNEDNSYKSAGDALGHATTCYSG